MAFTSDTDTETIAHQVDWEVEPQCKDLLTGSTKSSSQVSWVPYGNGYYG